MPVEDRAISDFPIALQLLNTALVLISNPDGQGGYDSYQATLTELGRVILETQYTQDLGNVDVFDAIKNCRTLSGTTNPTALQGVDGQLYVKYTTSGNTTTVNGLYVKLSGAWAEISTGGGGGDVGIECTQAQYDAWEQAGTLLADTNYYITDGQSGGGVVIDDSSVSSSSVWSSYQTSAELGNKANSSDVYTKSEVDTALSGKQNTLTVTNVEFTVASSALTDVKMKAVRYGNIVMLTGYFRTNANISDSTTLFSGMVNPFTPDSDGNLYFSLVNETDGSLQRFRINSPFGDMKNQGALGSNKTYVGTITYISQ